MKTRYNAVCAAIVSAMFAFCLTACGDGEPAETAAESEAVTVRMMTETECRNAIAALGNDTESLKMATEYYSELLARDVFTEEDYVALADVYAQLGDSDSCRDILWKLYRLYPKREYADKLSEQIVEADTTGEEVAGLLDRFISYTQEENAGELAGLVSSDEWKAFAWLDNGVITQNTLCEYQGKTIQISADMYSTTVTCLDGDGSFIYYEKDESGSSIISTNWQGGTYSGETKSSAYDADNNLYRQITVTLSDNICSGHLSIYYDGSSYDGELNSDGTSAAKQIDGVEGTVYAYGADERTYLYTSGSEEENYIFDISFIDLPIYYAWK